ncbi:hypothetical protein AGLY_002199 [Aphis glycines]|uniref:Zinc finger BED domain-containing protein 5 n=1 Tax=Aphis glycines TaxID=307491 RepID=A0A6G0U449_APHGL|nr:hypothetical protein AGLY_002199 [Aphis glycines]
MCASMDAQHESLLLHSEVRWLSRSKVLNRVLELKDELLIFFQNEKNDTFNNFLTNDIWCTKLAYLADIFNYLNTVNTSMQGKNENILTSTHKLSAFQKKISFWRTHIVQKKTVDMFPSIQNNINEIIPIITQHLELLEEKITKYFPAFNIEKYDWIRNPFSSTNTLIYELHYKKRRNLLRCQQIVYSQN